MASHVNSLAKAVIELEKAVGNHAGGLAGLKVREQDGSPAVVPVNSIVVSNGTVTDLGNGEIMLAIASTSTASQVRSAEGVWTVPSTSAIGDVVYVSGAYNALVASNVAGGGGDTVVGIIVAKPTATTASVAYGGEVSLPIAIVPGTRYYLGIDGDLITVPLDPLTNAGSGMVHRAIGVGISASKILMTLEPAVVL